MTEPICVRCARPLADGAYVCDRCASQTAQKLAEIAEVAPAARDVANGLSRRSQGGASGKPGSRLPLDLTAMAKLDGVQGELTTWARHVAEERGVSVPPPAYPDFDPIVTIARWLPLHLEWARHRPEADELLTDVEACLRILRGVARGPAEQRYLGPCGALIEPPECNPIRHAPDCPQDCGIAYSCDGDVYAREGAERGRCRTCGAEVATDERRAWLDDEVRAHAFRAAHIAEAYGINVNTIRTWSTRPRPETGQPALTSYYRTEAGIVAPWNEQAEEAGATRLHYVGDVLHALRVRHGGELPGRLGQADPDHPARP
jgi:hypothetical protein